MWTGSGYYSVLAWSTVVLESVPEEEMVALRSRNRDGSAARAAIARAGGPLTPTPEQQRAERVSCGSCRDMCLLGCTMLRAGYLVARLLSLTPERSGGQYLPGCGCSNLLLGLCTLGISDAMCAHPVGLLPFLNIAAAFDLLCAAGLQACCQCWRNSSHTLCSQ
jgi:hypothetical protein